MEHKVKFPRARLVSAIAAAFPLVVYAADGAGRIDFVAGNVVASAADGARRNLAKGSEIFPGDTLVTNDGRAQMRMTDGAMVSLLPGSEYRIDAYQFGGKADGSERGFFSLLKGGLRTITGLIGRSDRSRYRVDTKVATIGIRGTEFSVTYGNSINVNTGEGVVEVCNAQGCLLLYPGDEGYVGSDSTSPQLVQTGEEKPNKDLLDPLLQSFDMPAEQRNADGSSVVLGSGSTMLTGTATYATVYGYVDTGFALSSHADKGVGTGTINGNGELVAFEAADGPVNVNLSGGNSVASLGNDGIVAWGKWIDNGSGFTGTSSSLTGGEGGVLHYVTGIPTTDSQPALAAMYGTSATFSLLGGSVSGSSSGFGSITSASMNVNFTSSTVTSLSVVMSVGSTYTLSAPSLAISGFGSAPLFSGTGNTTGGSCATGCSTDIRGAFFGSGASRSGVGFHFFDSQSISGAVVLKNDGGGS